MLFDLDPFNVFIFLSGVAFLLKKVAENDRYHSLVVFVLRTVLSSFVIYLFFVHFFPDGHLCMPDIPVDEFSGEY